MHTGFSANSWVWVRVTQGIFSIRISDSDSDSDSLSSSNIEEGGREEDEGLGKPMTYIYSVKCDLTDWS
jgi:hypothetical protein